MKTLINVAFCITIVLFNSVALAQSAEACKIFLEKPIFTSSITAGTANQKESFRLLQCSANFKSASDVQRAGIDITVPIYDIPVPITANWDQNKVETWKSQNCTDSERNQSSGMSYYQAVYATNPVSANDALACFQAAFSAMGNDALRCELTETSNSYVFSARWRRTAGEVGPGPKVKQFTTLNTTCLNADTLSQNTEVSEGGVPVLCTVGKDAGAFALTTDRGGCSVSGRYRAPKLILPQKIILSAPFYQVADEMEFASNTEIVTNGFPFTLAATKINLTGPVSIRSFSVEKAAINTVGSTASSVAITARELVGAGGITILNAGQDGGNGTQGAKGPPGTPGQPGQGRTTQWNKICKNVPWPLNAACQLVPTGCEGGKSGTNGGTGIQGYPGNPGMNGGNAGPVSLDIDPSGRKLINVLVDIGIDGKQMACGGGICGGKGGAGGPGGAGGDGGPGGPGAPGTPYCGGTSSGSTGGQGPTGPQGPKGPDGLHSQVRG